MASPRTRHATSLEEMPKWQESLEDLGGCLFGSLVWAALQEGRGVYRDD